MSRGIQAGGKEVVKYTNTSDHYRVCSFSQNEAAILVFETTQFKFRQGLRHCCCCEVIYDRLTWSQQVIKVTSTHILSVEVKHVFILFPLSKKKTNSTAISCTTSRFHHLLDLWETTCHRFYPISRKRMQRGLLRATCSLPFPWEENVAQRKRAGLDCEGTSKRGLVKWSMDRETMNIRCNTVISWEKNSCSVTSNYETLWHTITSARLLQCLQKCFTRHFMNKPVFVFIHLSYVSKFKTHVFNWNT